MTVTPLDRRQRRRLETIEEVVDVAVAVMAENGVAGLSLGEVARRMGMRTPSLYVYFDSKSAVYDAVFDRGWREVHAFMADLREQVEVATDLPAYVLELASRFVRWDVEHPVYAQLMGWRPVPGYQPSEAAYASAVHAFEAGRTIFSTLQVRGLFRADVEVDVLMRTWTVLLSGVMTQQLANAPDEPFETGTFTSTLPDLVHMYLAHYGADQRTTTRGSTP